MSSWRALYAARRGKTLTDAQVESALASLNSPVDRALVGRWMREVLPDSAIGGR